MSAFTAGPWKMEERVQRSDSPGKSAFYEIGCATSMFWIAKVQTFDGETGEYAANARLIAAAPDLLAALKEMVKFPATVEQRAARELRALVIIAKAEGRS